MSFPVSINLYDLSQGMAKNMSRGILGRQIDGIWHTGIVVYGKEFYYGGGICQDAPGKTPYGVPMKNIPMDATDLPEEVFIDFLNEIAPKFSADKYDLFENNCNNFSDACAEFLTGTKIPSYITGLPKEVLATPMGQMMKPMINNMQQQMIQQSHPMPQLQGQSGGFGNQGNFGNQGTQNNQGGFNLPNLAQLGQNGLGGMNPNGFGNFGNFGNNNTQNTQSSGGHAVLSITDPNEFAKTIKSGAAIVDFFSYTCPPCMKIKPYFERLAQDYKTKCPGLKFISVDTGVARQLSMTYQISSIPTFMGFFDGQCIETFKGADMNKLQSLIYKLEGRLDKANGVQNGGGNVQPQGPEYKLLNPNKKEFYTFSGVNYAAAIKNINTQLEAFPNLNGEAKAIFNKFAENPTENVKNFSADDKTYLISWIFETMLYIEISDKTLGFLDLLRMLTLEPSYLEIIYTNEDKLYQIVKFLEKPESTLKELPKGLKLVLLRFITNLTATEKSKSFLLKNITLFTELLIKVGNIYKEDKSALHPVVMALWNITQNLSSTNEFKTNAAAPINLFLRTVFNENSDNEVLLGVLLVLAWIAHESKAIRADVNNKIEKAKLAKLEFCEDQTLGKISRDLSDILKDI